MTSNLICTPEYIVNGVSVDYQTYCEHQKTLKRSERYYYCQNPGCYEGFDVKVRNPRTTMFCCDECHKSYQTYMKKQAIIEYNLNPNLCKYDDKPILHDEEKTRFLKDTRVKEFCNYSCSAKFYNKDRIKEKPIKKPVIRYKNKIKDMNGNSVYILHCEDMKCSNFFIHSIRTTKYCSDLCRDKHIGGYRKGSGHSKQGYYKNIWCDSTYELAYVIYHLEHNIPIKRNKEKFSYQLDGKKKHYNPDFIVNNELIEIKGWHTDLVDIKALAVINKPLKILYKEDLTDIFNYVSQKYNMPISDIYKLYEDYTPEYKKCKRDECENKIELIPSKKSRLFCSVSCSTKYAHQVNPMAYLRIKGKTSDSVAREKYNKNPKKCIVQNCPNIVPFGPNVRILKYCSNDCYQHNRIRRSFTKEEYEKNPLICGHPSCSNPLIYNGRIPKTKYCCKECRLDDKKR